MKTKDTFKNAIQNLPVKQCPEGIWNKINTHLDEEDNLQVVIKELPTYQCPDDVWITLSDTLDKESSRKVLPLWSVTGIAASLILTLLCIFYLTESHEKASLSFYEEENIQRPLLEIDRISEAEDHEALKLIQEYCKTAAVLCSSQEYKFYLNEFRKLEADMHELKALMNRDPARIELLQAQAQLENAKSEIIKNMAKLLVR